MLEPLNLVRGISDTWTLDSGMALREDIKAMKTIYVRKRVAGDKSDA